MSAAVQTVHLALRVPLITRVHGKEINIIKAHNEIAQRLGSVAIAKFGDPGTTARAAKLQEQIEAGRRPVLLLIAKRDERFFGFQSELSVVHLGRPTSQIAAIQPPYYEAMHMEPRLWFVVKGQFISADLRGFRLASSGRGLLEVVRESRTTAMLIEQRGVTGSS